MSAAAKRYGAALFELAQEEGLEESLLRELDGVLACFALEEQYYRLLSLPGVSRPERRALLDEAFGASVHVYVSNFLKLLCDEGLIGQLPACVREFRARWRKAHGILLVRGASAAPLEEEARERLIRRLAAATGKQIELELTVDPSLLGGLRLDMDGVRLDGTLRRRLEVVRSELEALTL